MPLKSDIVIYSSISEVWLDCFCFHLIGMHLDLKFEIKVAFSL